MFRKTFAIESAFFFEMKEEYKVSEILMFR